MERLNKAANGEYHKVKHGTKLLELIDPAIGAKGRAQLRTDVQRDPR